MRRVVIDAATFIEWFGEEPEPRRLRAEYEAGQLGVLVPSSFVADVLGLVAGRGWPRERIVRLAHAIDGIGFEVWEPEAATVARWLGDGIAPALAACAAVAEASGRPLVARDPDLRRRAAPLLER